MINKRIDEIEERDIDALVTDGEPESRTIDYKGELPGGKDDDKREFLADVSAFANASGGDIVFGVEEGGGDKKGIPTKVVGLSGDMDGAILRLESMLRSGLEPVLPGLRIRRVDRAAGPPVLVLRVPKSWLAPHRVTFRGHDRFYVRTSAGKDKMDVTELRAAFALSEGLPERLRRFRRERLALIAAGETPAPLVPGPKVVLHVVPFDAGRHLDMTAVAREKDELEPMNTTYVGYRFNVDGYLAHDRPSGPARPGESYVQVLRSGALEYAWARLCWGKDQRTIDRFFLEGNVVEALRRGVELLRGLDFGPPIFALMTMLGVKGLAMGRENAYNDLCAESDPFDRDDLLLPDVAVQDFADDAPAVLKPAFDTMWQAAGKPGSPNYDKDGTWTVK